MNLTKKLGVLGAAVAAGLAGALALSSDNHVVAADDKGAGAKVDPAIKKYEQVSGIAGKISSVGSDTLNNLMTFWADGFKAVYPNVTVEVDGKGSSTAPPALIDGTAHLGPMSRPMKQEEIDKFEKKFGYKPTAIATSVDALAVFVHKDNPIEKLSLPQVDAIFSSTRKGKHSEDITKWGQVGLTGDWANADIVLYGRNSASGTYGYFKEHALYKGDLKPSVKEQPGSATVVQSVGADRNAAGYSGIGYITAGVRAVPLSKDDKSKAFAATAENCYSGDYPLSRFLLVYVNKAPGKDLDPVVREFLLYVVSQQGQEIVVKDGYIPLPSDTCLEQVKLIKGGK